MEKLFRALFVIFFTLLLVSNSIAQDRITIAGTGDSQQLLRELAKAFEENNPGTKIEVPESVGSSGGVKALLKGKIDIARIARPLKAKEKAQADDLQYKAFAYSPIVFAANLPIKCVHNLSSEQIVGIFSGVISDWSKLGNCAPQKINVVMREQGDSSRGVLEKQIPEFKAISEFSGKILSSTPKAVQALVEQPFTIGFLPQAIMTDPLQSFSFNGVEPNEANILNRSYPLASPLGLVWRDQLSALGLRFVSFIDSPAGARIIRGIGVLPASGLR